MSWSTSTSAPAQSNLNEVKSAIRESTPHAPAIVHEAIDKCIDALKKDGAETCDNDLTISTYGHIGADGQGNVHIAISATKPAINAATPEGSRELAEQLRDA